MSIRKDIKITLYCAQSFDMFAKTEFTNQPINLDLREDGNAMGANETVAKVISLLKKGNNFTAITVHDIALNIIGILIVSVIRLSPKEKVTSSLFFGIIILTGLGCFMKNLMDMNFWKC